MAKVVWVEWPDLAVPDGVELVSDDPAALSDDELARIGFYVPYYLSGRRGLEPSKKMPHLEVLQMPNAGFDDALPYLRPGITLCNARGVHDQSTAELALALTLAGRRGFASFMAGQASARWQRSIEPSLADSTVAVVGHGSIGRVIVQMLQPFAVSVTAFSRRGTDAAQKIDELAGRLGEFDVVILILPLTDETEHLVDAEFLAQMKDGALLVNVARGRVVDTGALLAELRSGRLRAAMDVTDPEPLPDGHPLWSAPNCIITPHVGGNTSAFPPRMKKLIEAQLQRWVGGDALANVVARG